MSLKNLECESGSSRFQPEKVLVRAFSVIVKSSQIFVWSSTTHYSPPHGVMLWPAGDTLRGELRPSACARATINSHYLQTGGDSANNAQKSDV